MPQQPLSRGDHVVATRTITWGRRAVARGTPGVIRRVGWLGGYAVAFRTGLVTQTFMPNVSRGAIRRR